MSKKMMKRSLALGALMAFVITGSAWAADAVATDNFSSLDESKSFAGGTNYLILQTSNNQNVVVNDAVDYRYTVTATSDVHIQSKVLGQDSDHTDKNVTFNKGVSVYLSTDSARNLTGKGAVFGIDLFQGDWIFNDEATIEVNSTGHSSGSATSATGVRLYGNGDDKDANLTFNGVTNITVTGVDTSDGTDNDLNGLPGTVKGVSIITDSYFESNNILNINVESKGTKENGNSKDGATAYGIEVSGGEATFNGTTVIKSTSKQGQAYGLNVNSKDWTASNGDIIGDAQVSFEDDIEINVTGAERAIGVHAENGAKGSDNSTVVGIALSGENIKILSTATGTYQDSSIEPGRARGVVAWNGAEVTLGKEKITQNIDITVDAPNADQTYGVLAYGKNSNVDVCTEVLNVITSGFGIGVASGAEDLTENQASVNVQAENILIKGTTKDATGLSAMSSGILNIEGNVEITATDVLATRGGATTNINASEGNTYKTVLNGDVNFNFYEKNSNSKVNAAVNINLNGEGSVWNGNTKVEWKLEENSQCTSDEDLKDKLEVNDFILTVANGAQWNPEAVDESGTVGTDTNGIQYTALNNLVLKDGIVNVDSTKMNDQKLEIENASGVGTFTVDSVTDKQVEIGDSSEATLTVQGSGELADKVASGEVDLQAIADTVVTTDGETAATTVSTQEGLVGGAYSAKVEDGEVVSDSITQQVNSKSDAVSDAGMTLKGHWRAHMNDMNKRMGELRNANGEHGVWTRMVRGESEYQGAKMQYNQYQLGYDEKLSVDKRWTVGAAVTFSEGDASYGFGSTDDKSTAFAIYGSKLNNDGTFIDLIARYAHLESDLDDRNYGTGDYSTNGMSVSAEFGKRIQQGNGLWIEPQVELTYGSVDSADVAFSKNFKAHYDSMDSFIARAGFALGKDIKQGNVYARASYLYDFDGETTTTFANGGKPVEEDFGGGWWEVGVGANINLSKATYIYADIEKTFGGEVDTNWQWNLGVRYSF